MNPTPSEQDKLLFFPDALLVCKQSMVVDEKVLGLNQQILGTL